MHQVLFGTVLLVSFLGGVVALLAPCCVSVMLPAYFAAGFGRLASWVSSGPRCERVLAPVGDLRGVVVE
jgi:cytochrome c biogenesis protein CcdA